MIFFDLDGTLCDPRDGICRSLQYALEELGHACSPDEQLACHIGPPLSESFAHLLNSSDARLINRAIGLYRERFALKGIFENSVYGGIPGLLAALNREDFELYVVTTKPTIYARQIVAHFALQKYFRNVHGSELDGTRTDKRALIAHVLDREQIHPRDAVMVGDREHDMKGALANDVRPIGVLWGYGSREELTQAGASALCRTIEHLGEQLFHSPQTIVGLARKIE